MAFIGAAPVSVVVPAEITFRALESVAISKSPFTHDQQIFDYNADILMASVVLPPMRRDLAEPWVAFLLRCRGMVNQFTLGDPNMVTPQGAWRDTDTVSATAAIGDREMTIATTAGFKAGDYVQFGTGATTRLYKILEDGGNGDTVAVFPSVRGTLSSTAATAVESTVGRFRLAQNVTEWNISSLSRYGIQFECMEVLP